MKINSVIIMFLISFQLFAQRSYNLNTKGDYRYVDYDWKDKLENYQLLPEEKNEPAVFTKYLVAREYALNPKGVVTHYYTKHFIVKLNSNDAVEAFNKLSFSLYEVNDIAKLKVRTINGAGVVKELDTSNMKYIENLDNQGPHKLLAIDGLEVGNTLEILYTLEQPIDYFIEGSVETLQHGYLEKNVRFELTAPALLKFKVKSINGLPPVIEDTTVEGKNVYVVEVPNITPMKEEQFAAYTSNLKKVLYKFDYNEQNGSTSRPFTWIKNSESKFLSYMKRDEKNEKELKKLIKQNKLKGDSYLDMIHFERYVKTHFKLEEIYEASFSDLKLILKQKYANKWGFIRLFCQLLNQMNVDYELAFTNNRFNDRFDSDFEGYNHLREAFIYIPSLKYYLTPDDGLVGNGWLSSALANCSALYTKRVVLGDVELGQGKVKFTVSNPVKINHDDIYVDLKLDENFDEVKFDLKRVMTGENISGLQSIWSVYNDEQRAKLYDAYLKVTGQNCKYAKPTVINDSDNLAENFPFVLNTIVTDASLWEKAGNKYFLKVGTLIGPQSEMYNKEARQNPVENTHNHGYHRVITFSIPDGYQVSNLNDINMDVKMGPADQPTCFFRSTYKQEGNKVTITCDEDYLQIEYPVSEYEAFRKVINASADFNKVKFIFTKK